MIHKNPVRRMYAEAYGKGGEIAIRNALFALGYSTLHWRRDFKSHLGKLPRNLLEDVINVLRERAQPDCGSTPCEFVLHTGGDHDHTDH